MQVLVAVADDDAVVVPQGPIAVPGKYTVEVSQMVEGTITEVVPKAEFEIEPISPLGIRLRSTGKRSWNSRNKHSN